MAGTAVVSTWAAGFVGSHFLLSHPLRRPLVRAVGGGAFLGLYSAVALIMLAGLGRAYRAAPATAPWWPVGDFLWAVVTATMLVASILLAGSLVGNPALPGPAPKPGPFPSRVEGVFAVTRHPMLWAFALWGSCHILVYPVARNIIVAVAIILLALGGAALQDRKKAAVDPIGWPEWQARTSFWPFAALRRGKTRLSSIGAGPLCGGTVLWLAATWAHIPLAGWRAGLWHWIGE